MRIIIIEPDPDFDYDAFAEEWLTDEEDTDSDQYGYWRFCCLHQIKLLQDGMHKLSAPDRGGKYAATGVMEIVYEEDCDST